MEITEEEIRKTVNKLSNNKATGSDEIPAEFLKTMGNNCLKKMTTLINEIYRTEQYPTDFLISTFIPIPKISRATKCEDHRTISLISHASKILLHIIKDRITPIIDRHLEETQVGFRKSKGTRDGIYLLRTIAQRRIEKKKDTIFVIRLHQGL